VLEIWKLFKTSIMRLKQMSEEEVDALYESATQYLKTVGAKWVFSRTWGQKV